MRVSLALLADYSNVSREGKLNILAIFDTIYASTFPTTHAHLHLVVRFEAQATEARTTRQVEVQFRSSDGIVLFRLPGAMTLQPGELGETIRADHVLNVSNLNFDRPGRYAFDVLVDGQVAATVPLRVEEMPARH